jgi:hypothetical protein
VSTDRVGVVDHASLRTFRATRALYAVKGFGHFEVCKSVLFGPFSISS